MVRRLRYTSHRPWCLLLLLLCSDQGGELAMLFSGSRISCSVPEGEKAGSRRTYWDSGNPSIATSSPVTRTSSHTFPRSSHCAHFTQ
ncbi:hypothetical protein FOMPIDRAFT_1025476 [Fomitopsis schrenkii]|uniref:Secreted protein n=1 Tax=Fomitopsis schrenkii TaxID=2126942 RepID=S8FCJ6_FOMSC|nr:hypothetical protein FOMPIDRAFT_1025476 [Fomitopsis schrenkii]